MLSFYDILFNINRILYQLTAADSKVREVKRVGFLPFVCWECRFESHWVHGGLSLMNIVCCQVQVSASGWSPFQRSLIECGVSEGDREASTLQRPCPIRGCRNMGEKKVAHEKFTQTHIFRRFAYKFSAVEFTDSLFPTETAAALRIQIAKFIRCLQIVSIVKTFR